MSDFINRLDAIDAIRVAYWDDNIQSAKDDPCIVDAMTDWAIRQVKELPKADVVEVVRCKHCKDYDSHDHRCKFFNHGMVENDYCNRAIEEKR